MLRLHAGSCAVLVGLLFLARPVEAATVTVSAETAGTTPDVVGYNTGHFVPGSNTADWWDYAGVNGARFFISPARIEPVGDDDADPWRDGVGNRDGFIARRAALRADPAAYNNFEYYRSRLESVTLAGSRVRVAYAFEELTRLGVGMVAMIGRTVARYPFDDGNPWADRWEHWQHYYAMAYVLASDYGVVRYQMYNEPNHSSNANLSQGHYVTRLRFASDAVQSAIADVNRDLGTSYVPRMHAPVTAGGGVDDFDSGDWGDLLLDNIHTNVLGEDEEGYFIAETYAYHTYNQTGPAVGRDVAGVREAVAGVLDGTPMTVAITEFNVHSNSVFNTLEETLESPNKIARFGSIFANLANGQADELYVFKFAQTADGDTVKKNGTHYVTNDAEPYDIGGVTRGAEVVRLFARGFRGGRPLYREPEASGEGADRIRLAAARDGAHHFLWSTNTGGGTLPLTLDLSAWGVPEGTPITVEEVSAHALGEVRHVVDLPPTSVLELAQPPRSVWLLTVPVSSSERRLSVVPVADATVVGGAHSAENFGGEAVLLTSGHSSDPDERRATFVRFDLGDVPGADVERAVLHVFANNPGSDARVIAHVYGIADDDWTEHGIQWANAPNLGEAGGAVDLIAHNYVEGAGASAFIVGHLSADATPEERMVDVTRFVRRQTDPAVTFLIVREVRFDGDTDDDGTLAMVAREAGPMGPRLELQAPAAPPVGGGDSDEVGDVGIDAGDVGTDVDADADADADSVDVPTDGGELHDVDGGGEDGPDAGDGGDDDGSDAGDGGDDDDPDAGDGGDDDDPRADDILRGDVNDGGDGRPPTDSGSGPAVEDTGRGGVAAGASGSGSGCACGVSSRRRGVSAWLFASFAALAHASRRRREPVRYQS